MQNWWLFSRSSLKEGRKAAIYWKIEDKAVKIKKIWNSMNSNDRKFVVNVSFVCFGCFFSALCYMQFFFPILYIHRSFFHFSYFFFLYISVHIRSVCCCDDQNKKIISPVAWFLKCVEKHLLKPMYTGEETATPLRLYRKG